MRVYLRPQSTSIRKFGRRALAAPSLTALTLAIGGEATTAVSSAATVPDAFDVVRTLQTDAWFKAQPLAPGEQFEFSEPRDVLASLQGSNTREPVYKLTVRQQIGSRSVVVTLRQKDVMAVSSVGNKYVEEVYPNVDPSKPPTTVRAPVRFFRYLISPDIVNRFLVRVRVGYMTPKRRCTRLSKASTLPSFDNYRTVALDKEVNAGDRVGPYKAEDGETFVSLHTTSAQLSQRRPLTAAQRRKGSCVVVQQQSLSRNPMAYGNRRERSTFVWSPFRKAKQSKYWPKTARISIKG